MKPMTFNDDTFKAILADFTDFLNGIKDAPDKINYSKAINAFMPKTEENKEKARLIFTADAYMKMMLLTKNTTDEIGWHGIVQRLDDLSFKILDILVFPQIVSAANVDPDAEEYAKWTMGLNDEQFNQMRFHGHSHVKMHINPSGTDVKYREDMLPNLEKDDFYIFLITNYDEKRNIEIYDKSRNIVYESEDINVYVCDKDGNDIMGWVKTQETLVKKRTYVQPTTYANTGYPTTAPNQNTGHSTPATGTNKSTETKVVTIPQHTKQEQDLTRAYWSTNMGLWVYENEFGTKKYSTQPPKIALKNPNAADDFQTNKQKKSPNENNEGKRKPGRPRKDEYQTTPHVVTDPTTERRFW